MGSSSRYVKDTSPASFEPTYGERTEAPGAGKNMWVQQQLHGLHNDNQRDRLTKILVNSIHSLWFAIYNSTCKPFILREMASDSDNPDCIREFVAFKRCFPDDKGFTSTINVNHKL